MPAARIFMLAACLAVAGCAACRTGEVYVSAVQLSRSDPVRLPRDPARPPNRDATLAYWKGLKAETVKAGDTDLNRERLGKSAERLDKLPVLEVDPDLVERGIVLAREMRNMAGLVQYLRDECLPPLVPVPEPVMRELMNTGACLAHACEAVNAMRPALSQRYGVEFPAE